MSLLLLPHFLLSLVMSTQTSVMILLSPFCSSILSCKQTDEFGVLIGLVVVVVMFMQQSNTYRES